MKTNSFLLSVILTIFSVTAVAQSSWQTFFANARSAEKQGKYELAAQFYKQAMNFKDVRNQAVVGVGKNYLKIGKIDEGYEIVQDYIDETNPFDIDVRMVYAEYLQKKGKFPESHKQLDLVDSLRKNYAPSWEKRGYVFYQEKNYEKCIEYLSLYLKETKEGDVQTARFTRAQSHVLMGQFSKAIDDFKFLTSEKPNNVELHLMLAAAYVQLKNYKEAEATLRYTMKLNPSKFEVYDGLGDAVAGQSRDTEAAGFYKRATEMVPSNLNTGLKLGRLYVKMKDWKLADDEFARHLRINPAFHDSAKELVNMWTFLGQTDRVGYFLKNYSTRYPDQKWAVVKAVKLFAFIGEYKQAKNVLKASLDVDANEKDEELWMLYGYTFYKMGDFSESMSIFEKIEKQNPENMMAKFNLGILYDQKQKWEKAAAKYTAIPEKESFAYKAQVNLALVFERQNRVAEAKDILKAVRVPGDISNQIKAKLVEWESGEKLDGTREPSGKLPASTTLTPFYEMEIP